MTQVLQDTSTNGTWLNFDRFLFIYLGFFYLGFGSVWYALGFGFVLWRFRQRYGVL
jgi:hypothetical protein